MGIFGGSVGGYHDFPFAYDTSMSDNEYKYGDIIISSDFDGGGGVDGWNDASETFNVTLELVKRGYSEEEIAKIWSGNLLRVLDKNQEIAIQLQNTD